MVQPREQEVGNGNRFAPFAENNGTDFERWAHIVKHGTISQQRTKSQSSPTPATVLDPKPRPTTAMSTEVELDALLKYHPKVVALTISEHHSTRKAAAKA